MGQEERKNKAKLEKTQIQLASTSNDYEAAVKALEETTGRWNRDWKAACDVCPLYVQRLESHTDAVSQKFQDLEEERLDFAKSSLWSFANIASTVCVSDDAVSLTLLPWEMAADFWISPAKRSVCPWKAAKSRKTLPASSARMELGKKSLIPRSISTSVAEISMTLLRKHLKMTTTPWHNFSARSTLPSEARHRRLPHTSLITTRSLS